jgi:endonuclease III
MSAPNRAAILGKVHKVLKKHYKPVTPGERSVLEHLLYAAILENADFETADENYARLQESYFDWNEVRVTTITELAETLASLSDASASAQRVKKTLQAVFETHSTLQTHYTFDLEVLKKQNLGKAIVEIEKFQGITPFGVAYVTQNALGGHHIACNKGALEALLAVGVINDAELAKGEVPGMERAIPKNKGVEFFSLLHQLGVDLAASPQSTRVKGILNEIDSDAKERLAQFNARRAEAAAAAKEARDQRIAVAREARAQEAREAKAQAVRDAQAKAAKEAQKAARLAKQNAQQQPPAPQPVADDKRKPAKIEEKAKPSKPVSPPPAAKPSPPKARDDGKGKKVSSTKGLTKRKPK